MIRHFGFSLIELIMFVLVTAILASTILLTFTATSAKVPGLIYSDTANQLAIQCMEGLMGQRRVNGYTGIFLVACPNTPATLPAVCSSSSSDYTITTAITCGPILGADSTASNILTVSVSGKASVTLITLIAQY
jgi:type II secretory pathway pseudopilin PulG